MVWLVMLTGVLGQTEGISPLPCRAEVRVEDGEPALFVNGAREFPFAYLTAGGDLDRHYKQFAETGVRFFTLDAGMGNAPEGFDASQCDAPFLRVLEQQPKALMFPRVNVGAPQWWLDKHPEERVVFDDGTVGPQSMFSEVWLDDACKWVEAYVRYLRASGYRDHVIGIHPCTGYTAEWQSWGLWDNLRGDFSKPARTAWRKYLRAKYRTDEALSAAWGGPIRIDDAVIPSRARREGASALFRQAPEWQDVMDFYDFYWRQPVEAMEAIAAAAKRGGGRDFVVGYFYGYLAQYGGKVQESQHLGLRELLECPDVDFLCGPAMYSDRGPGGTSTFMSATDSVKLHGKFWWDEADNRTHLAVDQLGRAGTLDETLHVLEREFAHTHTERAGIWWFDMAGGWHDDPAVMARLGEFRAFGEAKQSNWEPAVEVAVFLDDKSTYRMPPDAPYLNEMVSFFAALPRLGAPYHTYLLSDLPKVPRHRMYVFTDAFDLSSEERHAIRALKLDGRTLVFFGPTPELPASEEAWRRVEDKVFGANTSNPPMARLREAARAAGAHVYSENNDAFYAGHGMVSLHAAEAGAKRLVFPGKVRLREVFPGGDAMEGTEFELPFRARETRSFVVEALGE
ncbi:MAG: hypothetical protein RBU21_06090 [FCB group bacterium]|jgi:hypothetical protein|nr:hypothetical protein [FCB group bacterium]